MRMFKRRAAGVAVAVVLVCAGSTSAAEGKEAKLWWPQFLGPRRDGISRETGINTDWKNIPPKVVWKVPLGAGFSSLCIVDDRIYTMCQRGTKDIVVCLRVGDGKQLWATE